MVPGFRVSMLYCMPPAPVELPQRQAAEGPDSRGEGLGFKVSLGSDLNGSC